MFIPVGKIAKRTVWRSVFMLIRRSKYRIHSYRQLFRRFCPLGCLNWDVLCWYINNSSFN